MTSLHVTRLKCIWWGWESWSTFFNGNKFSNINWPFFENIRHSDTLSTDTVKLNAIG